MAHQRAERGLARSHDWKDSAEIASGSLVSDPPETVATSLAASIRCSRLNRFDLPTPSGESPTKGMATIALYGREVISARCVSYSRGNRMIATAMSHVPPPVASRCVSRSLMIHARAAR